MHLTRRTRRQAKKVEWADLSDDPPSYTWEELQEARYHLAWRLTGHPQGKLSTDLHVLEAQLTEYIHHTEERGWSRQGKENCYLLWELLTEEQQAALERAPSIRAIRRAGAEGEIGWSPICSSLA